MSFDQREIESKKKKFVLPISSLGEGSLVGEEDLVEQGQNAQVLRTYSLKCVEQVQAYYLGKEEYENIIGGYSQIESIMVQGILQKHDYFRRRVKDLMSF